jgi:hypothetical protein
MGLSTAAAYLLQKVDMPRAVPLGISSSLLHDQTMQNNHHCPIPEPAACLAQTLWQINQAHYAKAEKQF